MSPLEKVTESYWQVLRDFKLNDAGSTYVFTNLCAKAHIEINGEKIELILPHYKRQADGSWLYIVDNRVVDKEVIVNDLKNVLEEAVNMAHSQFKVIEIKANSKIKRIFGDIEPVEFEVVPGTNLSYKDIFGLVDLRKQDFLPEGTKFYFAPLPQGVLGATFIDLHKILYSPTGRRYDKIWGKPFVLAHEFVHNNVKLQGFPVPLASDVETEAFQVNLTNSDKIFNLLMHSYAYDLRRFAKVYFDLDSRDIMKKIIDDVVYRYVTLNEKEWKSAVVKINGVSKRLNDFIMNESYPEFMSFVPWWLIVNNYLKNGVTPIEVTLARDFTPVHASYYEYQRVMVDMRKEVDGIIDKVNWEYKMPAVIRTIFGSALSGPNYRKKLAIECLKNGFNENEFELIYHLALKKRFLKKNGQINYSAINLDQAQVSMDEIMYNFLQLSSIDDFSKQSSFKRKLELYTWLNDRLNLARRYSDFAKTYGSDVSLNFVPQIFDPRVNLKMLYPFMPDYITQANAKNKVFTTLLDVNKDGVIDYRLEGYDIVKDIGSEHGVDYVEVYSNSDTKPRIIAYVSKNGKKLDLALFDDDYRGSKDYGIHDRIVKIKDVKALEKLLK